MQARDLAENQISAVSGYRVLFHSFQFCPRFWPDFVDTKWSANAQKTDNHTFVKDFIL